MSKAGGAFLKQVLGMTDDNLHQLFFTEVGKLRNKSYRCNNLFALGSNNNGQCFYKPCQNLSNFTSI